MRSIARALWEWGGGRRGDLIRRAKSSCS